MPSDELPAQLDVRRVGANDRRAHRFPARRAAPVVWRTIRALASIATLAGPASAATLDGFAEPWHVIEVSAAEPGLVMSVEVDEGDRVAAGQVLAQLDHQALLAAREIARARSQHHAQLDLATAEVELRGRRLEKLRELDRAGHARPDEIDRAEADLAIAVASQLAAQEEQELASLEFGRMETLLQQRTVRSPIAGVVTEVHRQPAEFVAGHEPRMFTVVELDRLRVRYWLSPAQAREVRPGSRVRLAIADQAESVSALVHYVAPVTDAESGTVRVDLLIENADGSLTSGLRCLWNLDEPAEPTGPASE